MIFDYYDEEGGGSLAKRDDRNKPSTDAAISGQLDGIGYLRVRWGIEHLSELMT